MIIEILDKSHDFKSSVLRSASVSRKVTDKAPENNAFVEVILSGLHLVQVLRQCTRTDLVRYLSIKTLKKKITEWQFMRTLHRNIQIPNFVRKTSHIQDQISGSALGKHTPLASVMVTYMYHMPVFLLLPLLLFCSL